MLGNFEYYNPTKLYFGEQALDGLRKELPKYGKNILLVYGGGSIQKNGIYDQVVSILQECGKTIVEDAGVMPNPTVEKLKEGCERARAGKLILFWQLAAVLSATMRKPFLFPCTVRKTRGKSSIFGKKSRKTRSFRWAVC